jgi:hypothetical protein
MHSYSDAIFLKLDLHAVSLGKTDDKKMPNRLGIRIDCRQYNTASAQGLRVPLRMTSP